MSNEGRNTYDYAYGHWRETGSLPADLSPEFFEELADATKDTAFEKFLREEIEKAREDGAL